MTCLARVVPQTKQLLRSIDPGLNHVVQEIIRALAERLVLVYPGEDVAQYISRRPLDVAQPHLVAHVQAHCVRLVQAPFPHQLGRAGVNRQQIAGLRYTFREDIPLLGPLPQQRRAGQAHVAHRRPVRVIQMRLDRQPDTHVDHTRRLRLDSLQILDGLPNHITWLHC